MSLHNRCAVNMFLCRLVPIAILLIVLEADSTVLAQTVSHPGFMLRKAEGTLKRERGLLVNRLAKLEKAQADAELLDSQLNALASEEAKLKVSMEAYPEILRSLQTQRVQLMIDLAGIDAKRAKMIELMSGDNSKSTREAALGPLMEMVETQTKHLQRLEQIEKEGRPVDPAQVHAVKMSILSTRLKVEQEAARNLQPSHLNEMALNLTLDRAEKKARMERTEGLLKEIFDSRSVLMAREKLVEQRARILGRLSSLEVAVEEQREEVDSREMDLKRMQEEMEAGQDE